MHRSLNPQQLARHFNQIECLFNCFRFWRFDSMIPLILRSKIYRSQMNIQHLKLSSKNHPQASLIESSDICNPDLHPTQVAAPRPTSSAPPPPSKPNTLPQHPYPLLHMHYLPVSASWLDLFNYNQPQNCISTAWNSRGALPSRLSPKIAEGALWLSLQLTCDLES